jgi:PAS domain S-box-containing protein
MDISERTSGRELDAMFDQAPVALVWCDAELRYKRSNAAFRRLVGFPDEALIGRRPSEVDPGTDTALVERTLAEQVIKKGAVVADVPLVQNLAGRRRAFLWSASRLVQNGQVLGALCSLRDITGQAAPLRQAHALLERARHQLGTTLDIRRTAAELADLAVPELADHIAIDLLDQVLQGENLPPADPGTLRFRRIVVRDTSDIRAKVAFKLGDLITAPLSTSAAAAVWQGEPLLARNPAEMAGKVNFVPSRMDALVALGMRTSMVVPLIARGITLGVATLCRAEQPDPFDEADMRLASDLASRAALCIDNARLYTREHATAVTLQRSLLPWHIPRVAGLQIAYRYEPASQTAEVGGDWFDVIPVADDQVALVVGDVTGHSIQAAAIMGQLRTTTATLARLRCPPGEIMAQLNGVVAEHGAETGATCVYAEYDPRTRRCRLTSAGHPPPALRHPDGTTEFIDIPGGVMLGVGQNPYPPTDTELPPGSVLALYTDGLIEQLSEDIGTGMSRLAEVLAASPARSPDELCDNLLASLGARARDDIALLLARTTADDLK